MRNNKTRFLLILVLAFAAMGPALAQKGAYQSKKFDGLGPKDGIAYLGKMQYDEKSQFMYLVRNDDSKLYIDVIMSDRAAIQKTMAYGLTTWINPLGKKKKDLGIVFPEAGGSRSDQGPGMRKGDMKDKGAMMAMAMQEKNSRMMLKGFPGLPPEKEINPMTGDGVRGKFEHLEGDKVRVALAIPLEMLGIKDKTAMKQPISIGFETGYLDLNRSGMASSSGMGSGGGGDHGHGGPPGGGPPSGGGMEQSGNSQQQQQPNLNKLASPSKMWIKQVLLTVD